MKQSALNLFQYYSLNRTQYVDLQGAKSNCMLLKVGDPKGSIIGLCFYPLLIVSTLLVSTPLVTTLVYSYLYLYLYYCPYSCLDSLFQLLLSILLISTPLVSTPFVSTTPLLSTLLLSCLLLSLLKPLLKSLPLSLLSGAYFLSTPLVSTTLL